MKRPEEIDDLLVAGAGGGLVAGIVVALWFLGVDIAAGQAFRTPAVLGYVLMQLPEATPSIPVVVLYTILHFGLFIGVGVAAAWVLATLEAPAGVLAGMVIGLLVLHLVYYGALFITGANLLGVLPWYQVLPANLLAGLALTAYLHRVTHEDRVVGLGVLRGHPLLTRGVVTGILGAAVVAAWFLALDAVTGRPFRTPAALGSALFFGTQSATEVRASFGLIAGYTVVHAAAFIAAGLVFVAAAEYLERAPARLLLFTLAFIVLEAATVTLLSVAARWVLGTLGIVQIAAANFLAVAAMGARVWRTHPVLRQRLKQPLQVNV